MECEYYSVSWALQTLPWTLCLAIWCEIIRVISQSSHLAALALLNHKYDFKPRLHDTNCNYPCQNKGIFKSVQNVIDPVLRLFIMCYKISQMAFLSLLYFNLIGYFERVLKSDWLFCFSVNFLKYHIRTYRALKFF